MFFIREWQGNVGTRYYINWSGRTGAPDWFSRRGPWWYPEEGQARAVIYFLTLRLTDVERKRKAAR